MAQVTNEQFYSINLKNSIFILQHNGPITKCTLMVWSQVTKIVCYFTLL